MTSFGGISFSGLASGLDTQAILRALLAAESAPLERVRARREAVATERGLWDRAGTLLRSLQSTLERLTTPAGFAARRADTGSSQYLTASIRGSGGATGTWRIAVEQLATAQTNVSDAFRATETFGGGSVTFTIDGRATTITFTDGTLQDVADTINAQSGLGIRATVVDDGTAAPSHRLVLSAGETGAVHAFTVQALGDESPLRALFDGIAADQTTAARDAVVRIDGVRVQRPTNSLSDVLAGVTIELLAADPQATTQLRVSTDTAATADAVAAMVDAYNALVDFADRHASFEPDTGARGALFGDPALRNLLRGLRSEFTIASTANGNVAYELPSFAGLEFDRDGRLGFSRAEFEAALGDDPDAVAALFGAGDGFATRLATDLAAHLETGTGTLATRLDGFDRRIDDLDDSIARAERRLAVTEATLEARFAALETLLATLRQQSAALGSLTS
ncbi:MAG: flagellar filament capping protein FliD [Planctomycetes bacterium]|nr:flagellar filament capping protein FliD [Planctomycetota bacterium]